MNNDIGGQIAIFVFIVLAGYFIWNEISKHVETVRRYNVFRKNRDIHKLIGLDDKIAINPIKVFQLLGFEPRMHSGYLSWESKKAPFVLIGIRDLNSYEMPVETSIKFVAWYDEGFEKWPDEEFQGDLYEVVEWILSKDVYTQPDIARRLLQL